MSKSVLIVDDSESMRSSIRRILEESDLQLAVVEAKDGAEALPIALSGEIDIVVSDIVMPRLDGIQLLRGIRKQRDVESLPVILVTSQTDGEVRAQSFEQGASDYLSKPFAPSELVSRIQVQLRLMRLQEELKRQSDKFTLLGTHDELTGMANRRAFFDTSKRELTRCSRHGYALTVLVLDVDDFRGINARVGYLVGDAVIVDLVMVVNKELRGSDLLARIAGEKFGVLLPQTDAEIGRQVAARLVNAVSAHAFPNQAPGQVQISVGLASFPAKGIQSVDELINAAESNLDRAKEQGGNRVETGSSS